MPGPRRSVVAALGCLAILAGCSGPGGFLGTVRHPGGDITVSAYPAGTVLATSATAPYTVQSTFSISISEDAFAGPYTITMYSWNNKFNEPCFEPHSTSASVYTFTPDAAAAAGSANPCAGGEVETALITDGKGHDAYFSFEATAAIVSNGTTPTPAPTGSGTPAAACSQADPNTGSISITGSLQRFNFPACNNFTIAGTLPVNSAAGDSLSLATSAASQFDSPTTLGIGTPVLSLALEPGPSALAFSNPTQSLLVSLASPALGGGSYTMELRENQSVVETVTGLTPNANSLSVNVHPPSGVFALAEYVIIFYKK